MLSEFEEKMLEEITKIRETLATMLERDKQTQSRLAEVERKAGAVENLCLTCPARIKMNSWTTTVSDVVKLAGAVAAIWAAFQIVAKVRGWSI